MGDRVLMLENAIYSVISPESCSAILWKDQEHAKEAAEMLHLTAPDLLRFRVIDAIVPEPPGGAQQDWDQAAANLKKAILTNLAAVSYLGAEERCLLRFAKFRQMGEFIDG
jgi:acetyl-CoA carboxylase alpha subunit